MEEIYVNIAGLNIRIVFGNAHDLAQRSSFIEQVKDFLEGFIAKSSFAVNFTIEVIDMQKVDNAQAMKGKQHYSLFYQNITKTRISTYFQISLYEFEILIQNALYYLLGKNNGFLLHASAAKIGKDANLFLGRSGAGKSTSVALLKNAFQPLSDDSSIIRKTSGQYFYFRHPFTEKNVYKNKDSKPLKIARILIIRKAQSVTLKKIGDKTQLAKLLISQIQSPNEQTIKNVMEFATRFEGGYILKFPKNKNLLQQFFKNLEKETTSKKN